MATPTEMEERLTSLEEKVEQLPTAAEMAALAAEMTLLGERVATQTPVIASGRARLRTIERLENRRRSQA